jgi:multidrug resistance efflux pump
MLTRVIAAVVVVGVLIGLLVWSQRRAGPLKVSGYVEADEVRVGSRVGGRVKTVRAEEGSIVRAGDVLVELEPYDLNERRAEAAAVLAQRSARLDELIAGPRAPEIAAARASVEAAAAQRELAQLNFDKVKKSFEGGAASPEELDRATQQLKSAAAELERNSQQLKLLEQGTRPEEVAQARAALEQAKAALQAIDRQLEELVVKAPIDGRVEAVNLEPGDLIAPNAPVLSLTDLRTMWVRAFVPERHMNLQNGQPVRVSVDSFPGRFFAARVTFIASQGEFTPSNVQTPEERSKQVFRIKATLDEGADVLRPGMAADVWLGEPK